MAVTTAQSRYANLETIRDPYLKRARECARYTIPALMPPEGATGTTELYTPWQSVGARAVNNLASKLLLALFPPGASFFRFAMNPIVLGELAARAGGDEAAVKFDEALATIESVATSKLEADGVRSPAFEAIKHLIAAGNCLVRILPKGGLRYFPLHQYVVKRDGEGNVLEIIVKESYDRSTVPPEVAAVLAQDAEQQDEKAPSSVKTVDVFTRIYRERTGTGKGRWRIYQEVEGQPIPGTEGQYPIDKSPWLALRMTRIDGEDYGRGLCEQYLGDLRSLESLAQSIVEFSAAAAKILFLVRPGTSTRAKTLAEKPSGSIVEGDPDDVGTLQLDKYADFQVAQTVAAGIEQRLAAAFLLNSSVSRNAERVTAEEIRYLAQELEASLGGVYSILAEEFQRPLIQRLLFQMERDKDIPALPKGAVKVQIVTGLDALGRGGDLTKLDLFLAGVQQALGQDAVAQYVNVGAYMTKRAALLGLSIKGLVRTEEEVQQQQQAAMQAQMAQAAIPNAVRVAGDMMTQPPADGAASDTPPTE